MFEGVLPAIITPFLRNQQMDLDTEGLRANIGFLLDKGVHGIVPCGSTGESATLTFEEHEQVIGLTIDAVNGKVPVLAGTGSNNTAEAVRFTEAAKDLGADGVLVISPYYNKPNRAGLIKHYTRLADLDIPVIMYNVPGRTGQNLEPDLVAELARHPNIVGIKEASGNIAQISRIIEETLDEDFAVISGDDNLTLPILALGGAGSDIGCGECRTRSDGHDDEELLGRGSRGGTRHALRTFASLQGDVHRYQSDTGEEGG